MFINMFTKLLFMGLIVFHIRQDPISMIRSKHYQLKGQTMYPDLFDYLTYSNFDLFHKNEVSFQNKIGTHSWQVQNYSFSGKCIDHQTSVKPARFTLFQYLGGVQIVLTDIQSSVLLLLYLKKTVARDATNMIHCKLRRQLLCDYGTVVNDKTILACIACIKLIVFSGLIRHVRGMVGWQDLETGFCTVQVVSQLQVMARQALICVIDTMSDSEGGSRNRGYIPKLDYCTE